MWDNWLNQMRLDMVQYWIRYMKSTKPLSPLTSIVSALSASLKHLEHFTGMTSTSPSSIQYKKINSPTLPPCICLPCLPTPLPCYPAPLPAYPVKMSVFERFKRVFVGSGVWVSSEAVILRSKAGVSYVGIQSYSVGKSQFYPFSRKVKPNSVKNVQNKRFFHVFVRNSCVLRVFSNPAHYVQENKPNVSITSA